MGLLAADAFAEPGPLGYSGELGDEPIAVMGSIKVDRHLTR
jgi:hypothetical protein